MNTKHSQIKLILKILGFIILATGIGLLIFGIVDFANATHSMPQNFWALIVGTMLMPIGGVLLLFGFRHEMARYVQEEAIEIQKKHMEDLQDTFRQTAKSINSGVQESNDVVCPNCHAINDNDDKFCKACGKPINTINCPFCGQPTDSDSIYCQKCGKKIK